MFFCLVSVIFKLLFFFGGGALIFSEDRQLHAATANREPKY